MSLKFISSNEKHENARTDDDGFKILYEASQRKLETQEKKVKELTNSYEALKRLHDSTQKIKDGDIQSNDRVLSDTDDLTTCSVKCCEEENNEFMLKCAKCKNLTHYACTQLPPYQIALFLQKSYRLYQCAKCVGNVHKDIYENCQKKDWSTQRELQEKVLQLQRKLDEKSAENELHKNEM